MAGVYISYPFCTQKCTFCNFASGVFPENVRARYHATLLKEIRAHAWQWKPETIYLGGGTPSLMPLSVLSELMNSIPQQHVQEVTIECALGSIDSEKVNGWRKLGVGRVSLGVQSFLSGELRQTGRRHTAEVVAQEVGLLREAGITNINIDLIAGLPGQTVKSWEESLDWIGRLQPPHVSVYLFEIDEDSRLGDEILKGGSRYSARTVPSGDLAAEFYERAVERLLSFGIIRYEISNFAIPGWESRHNLKYWQLERYVGFGLDAHSFDGVYRWSNPDMLDAYFDRHENARAMETELIASDLAEERFFVGLRLMRGIQPSRAEWSRFASGIEKNIRAGLLERDGERLRLSSRGVLLSNEVFEEFVSA